MGPPLPVPAQPLRRPVNPPLLHALTPLILGSKRCYLTSNKTYGNTRLLLGKAPHGREQMARSCTAKARVRSASAWI